MTFKPVQSIYEYRFQDWNETVKVLAEANKLAEEVGEIDPKFNNVWTWIRSVQRLIINGESATPFIKLSAFEKALIGLLDIDLLRSFVAHVNKLKDTLEGRLIVSSDQKIEGVVGSVFKLTPELLAEFGLRKDIATVWVAKFTFLNESFKADALKVLDDVDKEEDELNYMLGQIAGALGYLSEDIVLYKVDEMVALFSGQKKEYNPIRLVRSFYEHAHGKEAKALAEFSVLALSDDTFRERPMLDWEDVLILTLMAFAAFNKLRLLTPEVQEGLLRSYFYRAVVLGVPVREYIKNALILTRSQENYLLRCEQFSDYLTANIEDVLLLPDVSSKKMLGLVFTDFSAEAGARELATEMQKAYAAKLVEKMPRSRLYTDWLAEAIGIYVDLKNGNILKFNSGEESEGNWTNQDMTNLITWFGQGAMGTPLIVEYFKNPEATVSLAGFFYLLKQLSDLNQPITIENATELAAALRESGVVSNDFDLVEYDQVMKKFVWSQNINKVKKES